MKTPILAAAAIAACGISWTAAHADGMVEPMQSETSAAPEAAARPAPAEQAPSARLTASLSDEQTQAQKRQATVKVEVSGVRLIDPSAAGEKPQAGQAHLSYQVDDDPVIETTATTMSFRDLDSGNHTITVMLSGNDHAPLGPSQTLQVNIP